jgi:hypothetical protein
MPAGATLNHGAEQANGDWLLSPIDLTGLTLTPALNSDNPLSLLVEATSTDTAIGDATSAKQALNVTVNPEAPSLTVHDAAGTANTAIALDINAVLTDSDPTNQLSLLVDNVPSGAALNHGTDQGTGHWALAPVDLAGLAVTPAPNDTSDFTLTVHATATDIGGGASTTTASLLVTVAH